PPPPPAPPSFRVQAQNLDAQYEYASRQPDYADAALAMEELTAWYNAENEALKRRLMRSLAVPVRTSDGTANVVSAGGRPGRRDDERLLVERWYGWAQVNEDQDTDNCYFCSVAVEERASGRGGLASLARDSSIQSSVGLSVRYGADFQVFYENDGRPIAGPSGVIGEAHGQGAGFRGIIAQYLNPEAGVPGHFFNVLNDTGFVIFLDGQANGLGRTHNIDSGLLTTQFGANGLAAAARYSAGTSSGTGSDFPAESAARDVPMPWEQEANDPALDPWGDLAPGSSHNAFVAKPDVPQGSATRMPGSAEELTSWYAELHALLGVAEHGLADALDRRDSRALWAELVRVSSPEHVRFQLEQSGFVKVRPMFGPHMQLLDQIIEALVPGVEADDVPAVAAMRDLRDWFDGRSAEQGTRADSPAWSLADRQGLPPDHLGLRDDHLTDSDSHSVSGTDSVFDSDGDSDSVTDAGSEAAFDFDDGKDPAAASVSLTDFLTGAPPVPVVSVTESAAYARFTAWLNRPEPSQSNLYSVAVTDPARAGSARQDVQELLDAGLGPAVAAVPDVPVLHLPVAEWGGRPATADVRELNRLLELFSQAGVRPAVVTRGVIDTTTAQVLDRYGAAAWHADVDGGVGRMRLRRPGHRSDRSLAGFDVDAHSDAVSRQRPPVVDEAPEWMLKILLEQDPQRQRDVMDKWSKLVESDEFLQRVTEMGERVPDVSAVRLLRPEVRLRKLRVPAAVRTSLVDTKAEDRSDVLLDTAEQLHDRGEDTTALAEMVEAGNADLTDRDDEGVKFDRFLVNLLDALDRVEKGMFTDAHAFLEQNRHLLTDTTRKHRVVDKLGERLARYKTDEQKAQAQALQAAVSQC
ncbi:hypothetical protein, partial [Actinoplanes sp. NBRC 103695]|uniref:hypothetical protein n=1 Tax=Actinoplanes sp. NBRC 103695 TaxID=3032202 RepID=UPI00255302C8